MLACSETLNFSISHAICGKIHYTMNTVVSEFVQFKFLGQSWRIRLRVHKDSRSETSVVREFDKVELFLSLVVLQTNNHVSGGLLQVIEAGVNQHTAPYIMIKDDSQIRFFLVGIIAGRVAAV